MPLPSVSIRKIDGGTGVVRPSDVGVLAIIAPSELGTVNQPETFLRPDLALTSFGGGPLVECAAYVLAVSGNPVLLVKGGGSVAAAHGAVTTNAAGTSVATENSLLPLDDYDALIVFVTGGTIGVPGITYTYSLDGGKTRSAVQSLGTATNITIPNSGVRFDFAAGTVLAGETVAVTTTAAADTNTDLVNALEALRVTRAPYECVLVHGAADATTIATLDTWLKAMANVGKFKLAVCTLRPRTIATETEAQYKTFAQSIRDAAASTDVIVCADVGDVASSIPGRGTSGITQARPVGWAVAARLMAIAIGRDAAEKSLGPLTQFSILDVRGNPKYHDEYSYPGLDDLGFTTLRTFDGDAGSFITNANLFSAAGSDYVYAQHARCINRACEIAYEILTGQLSRGVQKNPKPGPAGERYIAESEALRIEGVANNAIRTELAGQVDDIRFSISRNDNISSNAGATITGSIQSVALAYVKRFSVTAGFVKSISQ